MKDFLQFINEDIEIMANSPRSWTLKPSPEDLQTFIGSRFHEPKMIGSWGEWDLYETTKVRGMDDYRYFIIVQRGSGTVAGIIEGEYYPARSGRSDHILIHKTELQRNFQGKGGNIATGAYKAIAKIHDLRSSTLQSPGGASVWRRLLADPELRGRIYIRNRTGDLTPVKPDTKEQDIWAMSSEFTPPTAKSMPKFSRETKRNVKRVEPIYTLSLYIKKL